MTLDQRIEKARNLRKGGHNCAQCVVQAFQDKMPFTDDELRRLSVAFGAGLGGAGEVCGVVSAMALVVGMDCVDKKEAYPRINALCKKFGHDKQSIRCCDIKGNCMAWIEQAITLLDAELNES